MCPKRGGRGGRRYIKRSVGLGLGAREEKFRTIGETAQLISSSSSSSFFFCPTAQYLLFLLSFSNGCCKKRRRRGRKQQHHKEGDGRMMMEQGKSEKLQERGEAQKNGKRGCFFRKKKERGLFPSSLPPSRTRPIPDGKQTLLSSFSDCLLPCRRISSPAD